MEVLLILFTFFQEKLSEAKRKFDNLKQELDLYHRHVKTKQQQMGLFGRFNKDGKYSPNGKIQVYSTVFD